MNITEAAKTVTTVINDNLFRYTPGAKMSTAKMKRCVAAVNDQLPTPLRAYVIDHLYFAFNEAELSGRLSDLDAYLISLNSDLSGAGYTGPAATDADIF